MRQGGLAADATTRKQPRILFLLQDADGGVRETHHDLMSRVHHRFECFVLTGSLHRLRLSRYNAALGTLKPLDTWWLSRAWSQAHYRDPDYRLIYTRILDRLAIDLVHVRHLLGHTLDLLDLCRDRALPLVVSFHDFYLACPSIHLLDDTGTYCGGTCTVGTGQCRLPIAWLTDLPTLKSGPLERWRREVSAALPEDAHFVTTSQTAREVMQRVYPHIDVQVIEHGRDFTPAAAITVAPKAGERVRILAAGHLGFHKGADFLRRLFELDHEGEKRLELHVLGRPGPEVEPWAICHGLYRREEFRDRARHIAPSFAGVFSVWPETYSHTLTEAWSVGLPVLAADLGTMRERVLARGGGGWLIPVHDPAAAYRRILEILEDPEEYRRQCALAHVRGLPGVDDMARDYLEIYSTRLRTVARAESG